MDSKTSPKYPQYPPVLRTELELLDAVGQSAANYCGYVHELMRAVLANEKRSAEAALGILFGNPPLGVTPGWTKDLEKVEHLINQFAKPVKLDLPRHEDWLEICTYERPVWKTDEVEARLSIFERHLTRDTFSSALHAATALSGSLINSLRVAGLGEREGDLGGNLSSEQWDWLKKCLSFLANNDFAILRSKIEDESVAAKNYARETVVGEASMDSGNSAKQQQMLDEENISHSTDFRSLKWKGITYSFTANQSPVIQLLIENWQNGTPDVGSETLLEAVDPVAPPARLSVLFRDHPAWNKLIIPGGTKGTHRIAAP